MLHQINEKKEQKSITHSEKIDLQNSADDIINSNRTSKADNIWLGNLNLRNKATLLAIAVSTIPVLAIGAITYYFVNKSRTQEIIIAHHQNAEHLSEEIKFFWRYRIDELKFLASQDFIANPRISNSLSPQEKETILKKWQTNNKYYNQVAVFDLNGNAILKTQDSAIENQSNQAYFQAVLKSNHPFIGQPSVISKNSVDTQINFAVPIKDVSTGNTIAIIHAEISTKNVQELIAKTRHSTDKYYVADISGKVFLSPDKNNLGENLQQLLTNQQELQTTPKFTTSSAVRNSDKSVVIATYLPWQPKTGVPDLNWQFVLTTDKAIAFAGQKNLIEQLGIGILLTVLLTGGITTILAHRLILRIITANHILKQIGRGNLQTRMPLIGQDELTSLGVNINQMAEQLEELQQKQKQETEQLRLSTDRLISLKNLALHLSSSWKSQDIYNLAVQDIRQALKADRTVIYKFDEKWQGVFLAESLIAGFPCAMGVKIYEPCLASYIDKYRQGRVIAIDDIYKAGLSDCYLQQLETFGVKANLIAPIMVGEKLLGLLIAHQCSQPRIWQQSEIDLFEQFARLVGMALERANLLTVTESARVNAEDLFEEQRQQKEQLQAQLMALLQQIEGVIQGDLTVHAQVGSGEIGTIADFFNVIVENLRGIVTQVKDAAANLNHAVAQNSTAMQQLANAAHVQAVEIGNTLDTVAKMRSAIKTVAKNTLVATRMTHNASQVAREGNAAMDETVENILALRDTIDETAQKMKRFKEASQQITRVVGLINQISTQTNLLAINAGIEAAREGEGKQGFAAVAEEVAALATKTVNAASEIETIASNIQHETSVVVNAMELGNIQVDEGTRLLTVAKASLNEIVEACLQIDSSVTSISNATVSQVQASHKVKNAVKEVAQISTMTSDYSQQVLSSLQETFAISQEMQASVEIFKVGSGE